jgi:hypothetical protein
MLEAPQSGKQKEATDENPLVLTGDSVLVGWALFLESHYERYLNTKSLFFQPKELIWWFTSNPLLAEREVNGESLLAILPIAHKYCMDEMEGGIIKQLESLNSTAGYVDLLVASEIIDSEALHDKALNALIAHPRKPTLDQAKRIGMDAYFAVMDQLTRRCRHANCQRPQAGIIRQCRGCQQLQWGLFSLQLPFSDEINSVSYLALVGN